MLLEVHLLCQGQDLCRLHARDYDHAIRINNHDVSSGYRNTITYHRNVRTRKAIVVDRSGRHDP